MGHTMSAVAGNSRHSNRIIYVVVLKILFLLLLFTIGMAFGWIVGICHRMRTNRERESARHNLNSNLNLSIRI